MQEQEQQYCGQDDTGQDTAPCVIDGCLNECSGIGKPDQFHTGRQFSVSDHCVETVTDSVDDLNRIRFAFFDDTEPCRRFTVHVCLAANFPAHEFHISNVPQINAFVFEFADFERLDLFEILEISVEGDILFAFIELDSAEWFTNVVFSQLFHNITDRQIHRGQFFTVQEDMNLHFIRAIHPDFTNSGNRRKSVCNHVVRIVIQIVLRPVSDQKRLHYRCRIGVDLADCGLVRAVGQILADAVQRLPDIRGCDIDIGSHIEFQLNSRFVFNGNAGNVPDPVE